MPKKSSAKKPLAPKQATSAVEEAEPTSTRKKAGNEIDEIFSGKKRKKPEQRKNADSLAGKEEGAEKPKSVKKKNKKSGSKEDREGVSRDLPDRPRKRTQDGFRIYSEEELGLDKADAGGTPLCPFDCNCCF